MRFFDVAFLDLLGVSGRIEDGAEHQFPIETQPRHEQRVVAREKVQVKPVDFLHQAHSREIHEVHLKVLRIRVVDRKR